MNKSSATCSHCGLPTHSGRACEIQVQKQLCPRCGLPASPGTPCVYPHMKHRKPVPGGCKECGLPPEADPLWVIARAIQVELGRPVDADLDSITRAIGSLGTQRLNAVSREEALRWVISVQAVDKSDP